VSGIERDASRDPRPPYLIAAVVVAAAIASLAVPFWLLWDVRASAASIAFASTPQFVVWVLVLTGQAAVWVGAGAFVAWTLRHRLRQLDESGLLAARGHAAVGSATIALFLVPLVLLFGPRVGWLGVKPGHLLSGRQWPLSHYEAKVTPLVLIALVIGLLAVHGMWLTAIAVTKLPRNDHTGRAVERFLELRTELTALLAVAGVLIGLATLSSGAVRQAVLAANREGVGLVDGRAAVCALPGTRSTSQANSCPPLEFDRLYVISYGLLFSGLLAIAFGPSFVALQRAGNRLREQLPLPDPTDATFFEIVDKRSKLDGLLQTNLSGTATFKAAVAIVTPLAASLTSTLLGS
jgi:hypothetical protein